MTARRATVRASLLGRAKSLKEVDMKIIDTLWFSGVFGCIGIVVAENSVTGKRKAYIGNVTGDDAEADSKYLATSGSPVMKAQVDRLVELLTKE